MLNVISTGLRKNCRRLIIEAQNQMTVDYILYTVETSCVTGRMVLVYMDFDPILCEIKQERRSFV